MKVWYFRMAALGLGLALALGFGEVAVRFFAPPWLRLRMEGLRSGELQELGTDRGWPTRKENGRFLSFVPSSRFTISNYEYRHDAHLDELGGRVVPDATSTERIVPFVGDSFVFGIGVADGETFVNRLAPTSPLRLINLGIPGTSLNTQLDIVERRHKELGSPRTYVFVVFLGNDLVELRDTALSRKTGPPKAAGSLSALARLNSFVNHNAILRQSFLIQWGRQKFLSLVDPERRTGMDPVFHVLRSDSPILAEAGQLYREEAMRLQRLSSALDFDFVMVLIPDRHQLDERLLELRTDYYGIDRITIEVHKPNNLLAGIFDDLGIEYIDTTACVGASAGKMNLFYSQDNHLNSAGHRVLADCLRRQGLLDRIARSAS
jgi:hypothetical protein